MNHFPVNLVMEGRAALVVGGGPVAARKVSQLLACGAEVTVVAPEVCDELAGRAERGEVRVERRPYRGGEVAGYRLAVTATDDQVTNQLVYDDGEAAGVWVNSADDPARCSFTLPAVHRAGPVLLTASTHGLSPALSSWLRRWLEGAIGEEFAALAHRLAGERARIHAAGGSTEGLDWAPVIEAELARLREEAAA